MTSGPTPYNFTGKERDSETQNDYFGARYHESNFGRFLSPDTHAPLLTNPQTLNKYAYALNNPLRLVDPSGRFVIEAHVQNTMEGLHKAGIGISAESVRPFSRAVDVGFFFNDRLHARVAHTSRSLRCVRSG